ADVPAGPGGAADVLRDPPFRGAGGTVGRVGGRRALTGGGSGPPPGANVSGARHIERVGTPTPLLRQAQRERRTAPGGPHAPARSDRGAPSPSPPPGDEARPPSRRGTAAQAEPLLRRRHANDDPHRVARPTQPQSRIVRAGRNRRHGRAVLGGERAAGAT